MKETTLSCLNLFHITTSLKNDYGYPRVFFSGNGIRRHGVDTNLREARVIAQGDPQHLDTNFLAVVSTLPYISKASKGDRFVTDSSEIAGYSVRGWEGHIVATDGL